MKAHYPSQDDHSYFSFSNWIIPIILAVILVVISQFNFALFHMLSEFFAIVIAVLMSVVVWQMYPFSKNNFLMFLGAGYFWIGVLDLVHAFSYKGITILPNVNIGTSSQLWIVTRYLEALLLLSAPWFLSHRLNRIKVFVVYGLAAVTATGLILFTDLFPQTFVEGHGLTTFKVISEYIIMIMLFSAMVYLKKSEALIDRRIVNVMVVSIMLTICAELAFTFYVDVFGISNLVGHIFKLFSYWLIFTAMVRTTLKDPFRIMSKTASTYDAVPDATIVVDDEGIIHQANQAACKRAGLKSNDLVGRDNHAIFHDSDIDKQACPICQAIASNKTIDSYELYIGRVDKWYDISLSRIIGASEHDGAVEVIRDITQRKTAEQKATELDILKNSIVENLPNMLFVKDAEDHTYVEWNKAAEELTGVLKEDILGKSDFDFWDEKEAQYFIDKDKEVIRGGRLLEIEKEPITTKYKGTRLLNTKKIPIYNNKGKAQYLLGISEDITDKLKTEEMLRRSQKMEAVGQMSGGIAHDFNNQLGVILGYAELLSEQSLSEQQLKWIEAVQGAANRCADLTRQLLIFSREADTDSHNLNINQLVDELKLMIQRTLTPEIEVTYYLDEQLWDVTINGGEFKDALLNLVLNARDAMPNGGSLTIETSNSVISEAASAVLSHIDAGEYVQITITDSGTGMTEEVYEHVFEPFFTTKEVGAGTGLGLSMVYGFVHRYGGDIVLKTAPGEGASFRIYLPRAEAAGERQEIQQVQESCPTGNETILVVDDETALLVFAEQILKSWGYTVHTAGSAHDALAILQQTKVDLLFTDVVMPGDISGYELGTRALQLQPDLKILITSGYAEKFRHHEQYAEINFELIAKPYNRMVLAKKIRQLLDS